MQVLQLSFSGPVSCAALSVTRRETERETVNVSTSTDLNTMKFSPKPEKLLFPFFGHMNVNDTM